MLLEARQSCEKLVESSENFVDDVLLEASQNYEVADSLTNTMPGQELKSTLLVNESFARPVTEEDILQNIESAITTSIRRPTVWGVRVWTTWMAYRKSINNEIPPSLETITNEELNHWLARFVMEARNKNGQPYIGGTLLWDYKDIYVRKEQLHVVKERTFGHL